MYFLFIVTLSSKPLILQCHVLRRGQVRIALKGRERRAALLFVLIRPIVLKICGVVISVPYGIAKTSLLATVKSGRYIY